MEISVVVLDIAVGAAFDGRAIRPPAGEAFHGWVIDHVGLIPVHCVGRVGIPPNTCTSDILF